MSDSGRQSMHDVQEHLSSLDKLRLESESKAIIDEAAKRIQDSIQKTSSNVEPLPEGMSLISDMPIATNEKGGMQSKLPYRCDLLPAKAVLRVAEVFSYGAEKYSENNWRLISVESHINHGIGHILEYLAGDKSEPHLEHAAWRLLSALELAIEQGIDRNPPGPIIKAGSAEKDNQVKINNVTVQAESFTYKP